ncbi:hypothetical protein BGX31_007704 [Mortierella sp. GBA43]|nr:hypothetical protein BGX31_007704 [Mortierella sp. GBA43]
MKSILSSSSTTAIVGFLAMSTFAYAGCDLQLGFRVQYSDMAMLNHVQLQVLDSQNQVLIESLDNSTRAEWDDHRSKNVTWSVPADWSTGDYILRAFGNASYSCKGEDGHRTYCLTPLEDRQVLHLQQPTAGQTCGSFDSKTSTTNSTDTLEDNHQGDQDDQGNDQDEGLDLDVTLPLSDGDDGDSDEKEEEPMQIELDSQLLDLIQENGGIHLDLSDLPDQEANEDETSAPSEKNLSQQQPLQPQQDQDQPSVAGKDSGASNLVHTTWAIGTSMAAMVMATLLL